MTKASHAIVVVLGDLGRSPRMQYHAEALATEGWTVNLVGYADAPLPPELSGNPRIRCTVLRERWMPRRPDLPRAVFLVIAAGRLLDQSLQLLTALCFAGPRPGVMLVQVPPSFPTLAIAWAAARVCHARWMVDWHNFGFAMLALRLGASSLVVRALRALEGSIARHADAHLCVSRAMRAELASTWGIDAVVLADRPAARFRRLDEAERRAFLDAHPALLPGHDARALDRDAVVVSSTSWTADEDFALLLEAASDYERHREADPGGLPGLRLLITGRGPARERFESEFAGLGLRHVRLHTAWLEAADYPLALACADLGVSLHRSASGVDLPMKVADMIGAGLPVCMLDYGDCVREMTGPDQESMLFRSAAELSARWQALLRGFPSPTSEVFRPGANHRLAGGGTWQDGWRREAAPLFSSEA